MEDLNLPKIDFENQVIMSPREQLKEPIGPIQGFVNLLTTNPKQNLKTLEQFAKLKPKESHFPFDFPVLASVAGVGNTT